MTLLPLANLRQVVVVRTDHVGDLILSVPFLRALRQGAPRARISLLVTPYTAGVLAGSPLVDDILSYDRRAPRPQRQAVVRQVRALQPELAVALAPRTRSYYLAWKSQAPWRVGYVYTNRPLSQLASRAWLTHQLTMPIEEDLKAGLPVPHEIEQIGLLAHYLGLSYQDTHLELPVSEGDRQAGQKMRQSWGRHVVGLHLSNRWLSCGWRVANLVRLVEGLVGATDGGGVILTYGAAERDLAARLAESLAHVGLLGPGVAGAWPPHPRRADPVPVRLAGNLTLGQWAGVLGACSCVVTPDTGAVHVAAAMGRPVVVVYEPSTYRLCSQQWAPWGVPSRQLIKGHPMQTLSGILRAVEELLGSALPVSGSGGR
ncbi:MAG TPA: glycosyltransferase family 9 protein [Candidatus Nitrosotenuis sp.]|nr:glycosyltransferase family 9 protein [Candidatus Nitrosotenuis sp.]